MEFKEIISKVKDKQGKLKEQIEHEKKKFNKNKQIPLENKNLDALNVNEASKRGLGHVDGIFDLKIDNQKTTITDTHIIEKGDTLKSISEKYYSDSNKWIMIHLANIIKIPNPYNLIEGIKLKIPQEGEIENNYQITNISGDYIIQENDDAKSISRKIFGNEKYAMKLVDWGFFKYVNDIFPGKEVHGLKYLDLENQLLRISEKYNYQIIEDVFAEQENIIINAISVISRKNQFPPVISMCISNLKYHWMNNQYEESKTFNELKNWQPMRINEEIYKELFPIAAMDIEMNIHYGINILKELKKKYKTWQKTIVNYTLGEPLGIGKPKDQIKRAKQGIEFLNKIITQMEKPEFEKLVKSNLTKSDELNISYKVLKNTLKEYNEFIEKKYLW